MQRILDETGTAPGALALAEFALAQLYDKRQDDALTETAYEAIGGVAGAIDGLAEDAVKKAGAAQDEEALSRLFVAVASVEERGQELAVVRRRAAKSDLPGAALTLAEYLVDKRLLVSSGGASDQAAVFEVGHEAIFTHWKRFNSWNRSLRRGFGPAPPSRTGGSRMGESPARARNALGLGKTEARAGGAEEAQSPLTPAARCGCRRSGHRHLAHPGGPAA